MPAKKYQLDNEEIAALSQNGTRIRTLLDAQIDKVLREQVEALKNSPKRKASNAA